MAKWVTNAPRTYLVEQWTGDNFTEFEAFCAANTPWAMPVTDNGDGTVSLNPDSGMPPIQTGDWIGSIGPVPAANMASFQDVSGEPPCLYTVTGG